MQAKEYNKIAGIHNGTSKYAKKMIDLGFQFVTISSDLRSMNITAKKIIEEMKSTLFERENSSY